MLFRERSARREGGQCRRRPDTYPARKSPRRRFSQKVQLDADGRRLCHLDFSASCAVEVGSGDHRLVDGLDIPQVDLGAEDTHLYEKVSFGIRQGADGSLEIQA